VPGRDERMRRLALALILLDLAGFARAWQLLSFWHSPVQSAGAACRAQASMSRDESSWVCLQQIRRYQEELRPRIRSIKSSRASSDQAPTGPSLLIVVSHGLMGTQADLSFLKEAIEELDSANTLVLLARSNEGKTTDGVANGGRRLASEILDTVEAQPSLTSISMLGNSLGGLYARYAAALLYTPPDRSDADNGNASSSSICGLVPGDFVTTASPHLGVRRFTYIPVPDVLQGFAPGLIIGRTGDDLFLKDAEEGWEQVRRDPLYSIYKFRV
jgi:hypothetical protein